MTTYFPISGTVPQYSDANGVPYSGAVLKAYSDNTTTPISMATDYTGGTLVSTITLNSAGYPAVAGSVVVPHVAENYKLALYPTSAAAAANTGEIWMVDNFQIINNSNTDGALTDIASAATLNLNSSLTNYFNVTGTTTITAITLAEGVEVTVKAAGVFTITNNAFILNKSGQNIITAVGDIMKFRGEAGGVVRMLDYNLYADPVFKIVLGTPVTTTSGTAVDFTGIPPTAKKIVVGFYTVSTNGSDSIVAQLGDSGGIETSGYQSSRSTLDTAVTTSTSGSFFLLSAAASGASATGQITFDKYDEANNGWTMTSNMKDDGGTSRQYISSGQKFLSGVLDRVRITTSGGVNTFDVGTINVVYQ